jgi:hypothetical protein
MVKCDRYGYQVVSLVGEVVRGEAVEDETDPTSLPAVVNKSAASHL